MLKYYDCEIHYHSGKANVVADALSRKEKPIQIISARMGILSRLLDLIRKYQIVIGRLENLKQEDIVNYINQLIENSQGIKTFIGSLWVPKHCEVRKLLLEDAYDMQYTVHPGSTKVYRNLKKMY